MTDLVDGEVDHGGGGASKKPSRAGSIRMGKEGSMTARKLRSLSVDSWILSRNVRTDVKKSEDAETQELSPDG